MSEQNLKLEGLPYSERLKMNLEKFRNTFLTVQPNSANNINPFFTPFFPRFFMSGPEYVVNTIKGRNLDFEPQKESIQNSKELIDKNKKQTEYISENKIVKDEKPAGPLTATSNMGTIYTQVNDSTYDWINHQPGRAGAGTIHLDPNSGGPWGTYVVNGGSSVADKEKRLSQEALDNHLWNINNLQFTPQKPFTFEEFKKNIADWAREKGWIKADGGRLMRQGGKIIEVPFE